MRMIVPLPNSRSICVSAPCEGVVAGLAAFWVSVRAMDAKPFCAKNRARYEPYRTESHARSGPCNGATPLRHKSAQTLRHLSDRTGVPTRFCWIRSPPSAYGCVTKATQEARQAAWSEAGFEHRAVVLHPGRHRLEDDHGVRATGDSVGIARAAETRSYLVDDGGREARHRRRRTSRTLRACSDTSTSSSQTSAQHQTAWAKSTSLGPGATPSSESMSATASSPSKTMLCGPRSPVADNLLATGQLRAGRRVVKAPDETRGALDALVRQTDGRPSVRLTGAVAQNLAPLLVDAQQARSTLETDRRQILEQRVNIVRTCMQRASNGFSDAHHPVRLTATLERLLRQLVHVRQCRSERPVDACIHCYRVGTGVRHGSGDLLVPDLLSRLAQQSAGRRAAGAELEDDLRIGRPREEPRLGLRVELRSPARPVRPEPVRGARDLGPRAVRLIDADVSLEHLGRQLDLLALLRRRRQRQALVPAGGGRCRRRSSAAELLSTTAAVSRSASSRPMKLAEAAGPSVVHHDRDRRGSRGCASSARSAAGAPMRLRGAGPPSPARSGSALVAPRFALREARACRATDERSAPAPASVGRSHCGTTLAVGVVPAGEAVRQLDGGA